MTFPHAHVQNGTSLRVQVPTNTTFLVINGTVGPQFGVYDVRCEPQPPFFGWRSTSAYSMWAAAPVIIWYVPLDPAIQYACYVQSAKQNSEQSPDMLGGVGVSSFTFFSSIGYIPHPT